MKLQCYEYSEPTLEAIKKAFYAGFKCSFEGFNGEIAAHGTLSEYLDAYLRGDKEFIRYMDCHHPNYSEGRFSYGNRKSS